MLCWLLLVLHFGKVKASSLSFKTTISSNNSYKFVNFWNKCAGSGHASLALRADWQHALKECHDKFGLESVRFHGILDDDVGSYNGVGDYSFVNIDKIFDYMVSIGVHPYVELSYMPAQLSSNPSKTQHHYKGGQAPPKSWSEWRNFIANLTQHLLDRYDSTYNIKQNWFFEIWNEPDLSYADKKFSTYMSLFANTSRAIKSVSNDLRVGGPATAFVEWVDIFLNATLTNNIPVDFVSSHLYPTDYICNWTEYGIDAFKIALQQRTANISRYDSKMVFYLSEYDSGHSNGNNNRDDSYAASFMIFMAKSLQDLLVMNGGEFGWLAWWDISDIFEEGGFNSIPFNNGYGMQTIRGIKKPIFRALQLLYQYGSEMAYKTVKINNNTNDETVMVYVLKNNITNSNYTLYAGNWNYKTLNITTQIVSVIVENMIEKKAPKSAFMYRIDVNNSNPLQVWKTMGSPEYPTQQQLDKLNIASELVPYTTTWEVVNSDSVMFNFTLHPYSIVAISIQY
eukprot:81882_1